MTEDTIDDWSNCIIERSVEKGVIKCRCVKIILIDSLSRINCLSLFLPQQKRKKRFYIKQGHLEFPPNDVEEMSSSCSLPSSRWTLDKNWKRDR